MFFLFVACNYDNKIDVEQEAEVEVLDLTKQESVVLISDIFDSISYLPVRLPQGYGIGQFDKVEISDGQIFVGDFYQSNQVLILDSLGNCLGSINALGEGPGEYLQLTDFSIDWKDENITILAPNKILKFDFLGNFISESEIPVTGAYKFISASEGEYVFYLPSNMAEELVENRIADGILYKSDMKGSVPILSQRMKSKNIPFFAERNILSLFGNELVFSNHFSDTIYLFEDFTLRKKIVLEFGNRKFPLKDFSEKGPDLLNDRNYLENYNYHAPNLFYDGEFLISRYIDRGWVNLLLNVKTNKTVTVAEFENDLDGGLNYMNIKYLNDNQVYCFHYPEEFIELQNDKLDEHAVFDGGLSGLSKEEMSFVIVKYHLK
jgi:hypothetical protein